MYLKTFMYSALLSCGQAVALVVVVAVGSCHYAQRFIVSLRHVLYKRSVLYTSVQTSFGQ